MDESYRDEYDHLLKEDSRITWADPGQERQDSVFNGLSKIPDDCSLVAVHDSARPLVTPLEVMNVLKDAKLYGASVLGVPMKATVKESDDGKFVLRTITRSRLWEIHTPQVSTKALFLKGLVRYHFHPLGNSFSLSTSVTQSVSQSVTHSLISTQSFLLADSFIGFDKVKRENLEVTDDVSVIEALGLPVRLTLGEYTNIKLTTPDDLQVAEQVLRERGVK